MSTIIQQGRFISTGVAVNLNIRSDFDSIHVWNETVLNDAALAADRLQEGYWRIGMANGRGVEVRKLGLIANDPITTLQLAANAGFTKLNTTVESNAVSAGPITNITNDPAPVVTVIGHGYITGDIVRISNATNALQLGAIDYRITNLTADTFSLSWATNIVPGVVAAPGAQSRVILVGNEAYWIPKTRVITAIDNTVTNAPIITMAAPHDFTVGQRIRFKIPRVTALAFGMTELDGVEATVTVADPANNTITVNVETAGFTPFAFALSADVPFTPPQVIPVGEDTPRAILSGADILADRTRNSGFIGVRLASGVFSPAGVANDVIYWEARRAFNVSNN